MPDDSRPQKTFEEAWPDVRRITLQACVSLVGPDDADDICQQVAIRGFQRKAPFHDPMHVQAWALAVAKNLCRDLFRKRKRAREFSLDDRENIETTTAAALADHGQLDPETALLARELDHLLRATIRTLPPRLHAVAELYFLDEQRHEVVAATLHITRANARKRVQNARVLLRRAARSGFLGVGRHRRRSSRAVDSQAREPDV